MALGRLVAGCNSQPGDPADAGQPIPTLTWTESTPAAAFSRRESFGAVAFAGKMWVIGGGDFGDGTYAKFFNDVWSSTDGATWTLVTGSAPFSPRWGHTVTVFNDKMWVIGGSSYAGDWTVDADVWSSADGLAWVRATENAAFGPRERHSAVVFKGKLWLIGGGPNDDDVWSSVDGISWALAAPSISTAGSRFNHTSVVYGDRIWTLFGDDGAFRQDVVSSGDGVNWSNVAYGTIIEKRSGHCNVVFADAMWVLAGTGSQVTNEVWSSRDGVTWTANAAAAFQPRQNAAAVVFEGQIWIMGGFNFDALPSAPRNDVWHSN